MEKEICPNCGKIVEGRPDFCPYCNFPLAEVEKKEKGKKESCILLFLVLLLVIASPFIALLFLFY